MKEKLEKICNHTKVTEEDQSNPVKQRMPQDPIPKVEKRITRSQSSNSEKKITGGMTLITTGDSADSIASFSSIGVANRLEEIGSSCGFHEIQRKGNFMRNVSLKGDVSGTQ